MSVGRPRANILAAAMMGAAVALGGAATPAAVVATPATTGPAPAKDMLPGESRQRVVAAMVMKRKRRVRISGQPRGDGFDDARAERARLKRARKRRRVGGWRP